MAVPASPGTIAGRHEPADLFAERVIGESAIGGSVSGGPVRLLARTMDEEFIRYAMASAVALCLDVLLLLVLTEWAGVPYLISAAIGFAGGIACIYLLSIDWVFRHRRMRSRPAAEFALFALIGVTGLLINESIMFATTEHLGQHYMISKAAAVGIVFAWNFTLRKALLFGKEAAG